MITLDAIFEATIQVLLKEGLIRVNTTRIARRAGVSVGTLYQYFPNKQALLFALLERHVDLLADAISKACAEKQVLTAELLAETIVKAYLREKLAQAEVSPLLYRIGLELDARVLIAASAERSTRVIEGALLRTNEGSFDNPFILAQTLTAALFGTLPPFCHRVLAPADGLEAERQLIIMFHSYLGAHRNSHGRQGGAETNADTGSAI